MDYYEGYELDVYAWELEEKQKATLDACIYMLDNNLSLRAVARDLCIPESTLRTRIHSYMRVISFELYQLVVKQLKKTSEASRFGYAS